MERLLGVAQELSDKVESNESAAGELLRQCESLQEALKSMRQYRECVGVVSGSDEEGRVKLPNIEFSYIKQLQQDNSELRTLLEEHQAALAMIMGKYREQVSQFMSTKLEEVSLKEHRMAEEVQQLTDQVYNMAAVMYKAAVTEDASAQQTTERIAQLEYENKHLREILQFSTSMMEPNERVQPNVQSANPPPSSDHSSLPTTDSLTLTPLQGGTPSGHHSPHGDPPVQYDSGDSRCSTPRAEESSTSPTDTVR